MLLDLGFSESDQAIEQFFSLPFLRQCKIMTLGINLVHLHAVCVCVRYPLESLNCVSGMCLSCVLIVSQGIIIQWQQVQQTASAEICSQADRQGFCLHVSLIPLEP